jgi:photosynthetic reaction center H subunit
MKLGQITSYIDVAQVAIWTFWIFFLGLIIYLRREDRREGYPLFSEPSNTYKSGDNFFIPPPKVFRLPHGGTSIAPDGKPDERSIKASKIAPWPGAPLEPIGNPMDAAVGPGSYAERANTPDMTVDGHAKIVPMRIATNYAISSRDPDPRGMDLVGADGRVVAGTIRDVWVDKSETVIRYLEAEIPAAGGPRRILVPMNFAKVDGRRGRVKVSALYSNQFGGVPTLAKPDQVTLLEEDKICAYFGAGTLYADAKRAEPLL